jgi:lysophospholipase L1-like esterase
MKTLVSLGWLWLCLVVPLTGARAADTNHNFAKWEREISAFERSDATNPPPKGACLFIGSSYIRFWKTLATDFPDKKVINRGFGGSEIMDATHFAGRIVFPYEPSMIFLRSGGNDLAAGLPVAKVFADFKDFVETVQRRLPNVEIVYIALNPTVARLKQQDKEAALNALARDFINGRPHLHYLDASTVALGPDGKPNLEFFVKDKLHLNAKGYKLLAECVRQQWPK